MNIAELLAEAAEETFEKNAEAYANDTFEEDPVLLPSQPANAMESASSILKKAAQIVVNEDKAFAEDAFIKAVAEVKVEVENIRVSPRQQVESRDAEEILLQSSKEIDEYYNDTVLNAVIKTDDGYSSEEVAEDNENEENEENNDSDLNSQLIFMTYNGKSDSVRSMLEKGGNYFARDQHGWTPLHWAASKGFDDIIEILIRHVQSKGRNVKTFVNAHDSLTGWTALHVW